MPAASCRLPVSWAAVALGYLCLLEMRAGRVLCSQGHLTFELLLSDALGLDSFSAVPEVALPSVLARTMPFTDICSDAPAVLTSRVLFSLGAAATCPSHIPRKALSSGKGQQKFWVSFPLFSSLAQVLSSLPECLFKIFFFQKWLIIRIKESKAES